MPVYVMIDIKIHDAEMYGKYVKAVPPIVKQFGGRYLARGGQITTLFGGWHPDRAVLIEFDTVEQVRKWLSSPEYAKISPFRENSTETNAIVVEGGPVP